MAGRGGVTARAGRVCLVAMVAMISGGMASPAARAGQEAGAAAAGALGGTRDAASTAERHGAVIAALARGAFSVTSARTGAVLASRHKPPSAPDRMTDAEIVAALSAHPLTPADTADLWDTLSDGSYAGAATLPVITALARRTDSTIARDAMWGGLNGNAEWLDGKPKGTARGLLGLFEENREALLGALPHVEESEGAGDDMVDLMQSTRVFGWDVWDSLPRLIARHPAALARRVERERERGRPVKWEFQAFEGMIRWKDAHLTPGAPKAPRTLAELDRLSETYITMFNSLHGLDEWYRSQMLRGLGPVEVFNAAVGGERELYRLGTSSYRSFLHPTILKGIKAAGSLEAFLEAATPAHLGPLPAGTAARRGLYFLRIASSFGLLDGVLEAMRDRERFVAEALDALGDPRAFETSSNLVVDVLTGPADSAQAAAFRTALRDRLYQRYGAAASPLKRSVYGGMLSAYQMITGDRRDETVTRDFAVDYELTLAFNRVFRTEGTGLVHRMLVRLDEDVDAKVTFGGLGALLSPFGASVHNHANFVMYRIQRRGRTIEIYVNRPTSAGLSAGIADIGRALNGAGLETIIGRGHTGIILPLQKDARRVLGAQVTDVAAVFVGACGGDASVREMIGTFGTVPFVTTKSTGRFVINNAVTEAYIAALLELEPGADLALGPVLDRAVSRFASPKTAADVREDARLYQVNLATGLAVRMFEAHVRPHLDGGAADGFVPAPRPVAATAAAPATEPALVPAHVQAPAPAEPALARTLQPRRPAVRAADRPVTARRPLQVRVASDQAAAPAATPPSKAIDNFGR